jgi:hypothetical protein
VDYEKQSKLEFLLYPYPPFSTVVDFYDTALSMHETITPLVRSCSTIKRRLTFATDRSTSNARRTQTSIA